MVVTMNVCRLITASLTIRLPDFLWTHCESSVYWDTEILESKSF